VRGRTVARLLAIATFAVTFAVLDGPARDSFAVHMTQHMMLVVVLAPFVVLGWSPAETPGWARRAWFVLLAIAAQTAALVLWHVPAVFDAAQAHAPLHVLEHVTLLATAVAGWWVILSAPFSAAVRFAACAAAAAPMLLLGALLTFAPHPWYASYSGTGRLLSPLVDQQTGGAIMWGPAGVAYVVAAAWLVASAITSDARLLATTRG
jgi:putative membrane protein